MRALKTVLILIFCVTSVNVAIDYAAREEAQKQINLRDKSQYKHPQAALEINEHLAVYAAAHNLEHFLMDALNHSLKPRLTRARAAQTAAIINNNNDLAEIIENWIKKNYLN